MLDLVEMVGYVTNKRIKKRALLHDKVRKKPSDNYQLAYNEIAAGHVKTDEDMAELTGLKPGSGELRVFKSRFRAMLVNTILHLDYERLASSDAVKAILQARLNIFAVTLLFNSGFRLAAISLVQSTLKKALNYELTEIIVQCCRMARTHYAMLGDMNKVAYYSEMFRTHFAMLQEEEKSKEYYDLLYMHFVSSRTRNLEIGTQAKAYVREMEQVPEQQRGFSFMLNYYRVANIAASVESDYPEVVKIWTAALAYISKKKYVGNMPLSEAHANLLVAYMYLGNYSVARRHATECIRYCREGSRNWFTYIEVSFVLHMLLEEYKKAGDILKKVLNHPRFAFMEETRQEVWLLNSAYHYLAATEYNIPPVSKFKLAEVMAETPIFGKDKKGTNVSILILQVMMLLRERDYDIVQQKLKSLQRYSRLYLNDTASYRSYLFMEMLSVLDKKKFQKDKVEKGAQQLLAQLQAAPAMTSRNLLSTEIIPFERLWEIVLRYLPEEAY